MSLMSPWMWELWILGFWWSAWTLADQYLIRFSPFSELVVLSVCGTTLAVAVSRGRMRSMHEMEMKVTEALASVTQTSVPTSYGRQCE